MALKLPTLEDVQKERKGKPLPKPEPAVRRKEVRTQAKRTSGLAFRKAVWDRDGGKSRACGRPLMKTGTNWDTVGEVHHVLARSTHPDRVYDPTNGILLSRHEHLLAEAMCPHDAAHCLLDIEGPEDRGEPQIFIWRDVYGKEIRRKVG